MKRFVLCWMIVVIFSLSSFAQGVDFRTLTMREALVAATQEKKMIFIDFYTTWCGPCKTMSSKVFTQAKVGAYFNRAFVNLKIDAEKGEGVELAKVYQVKSYPTFVVLNMDGTEVYRISGVRSADELVERIRKGINPKWSPEELKRRYEKGERSPELINDYVLLQVDAKNKEKGCQVIRDYFDQLSDRKRVKPENFFLYTRYTLNYKDPKADYMFANKERFIKENGRDTVEQLLYKWLKQEMMSLAVLKMLDSTGKVQSLQRLETKILNATLESTGCLAELAEIAKVSKSGDRRAYLNICREKFPSLEVEDRLAIMLGFSVLLDECVDIKILAADLIRDNLKWDFLDESGDFFEQILYMMQLEFEGKKEYRLRASIDGVKKGKVTVSSSSFLQGKMEWKDYEFDNYLIDIHIAAKDTLVANMRLKCEELACPRTGEDYYPCLEFMIVPGESAEVKIVAVKGKVPGMEWKDGGTVSRDFVVLNYEMLTTDELMYKQLLMDDCVRGEWKRDHPDEFNAYYNAKRGRIMEFIRSNKSSYISVVELAANSTWFDENELEAIYNCLPEWLKNHNYGKTIKGIVERSRDFRTGMPAKDFTKRDINGKIVTLGDMKGKYVLMDFWGSWCRPCRMSHSHLKELYEKYKKQVIFINVAQERAKDLEKAKEAWKKAVKQDGLTWTQILNNEGQDKCDLVRLFNVSAYPTKILIDPDGIVISRMVGGMVDAGEVLEKVLIEEK